MKHIVFEINDKKEMLDALRESQRINYKSALIQVFSYQTDKNKLVKIINKISKKFPNAVIIGTTTAGEISLAKMYENSTVVSLSLFEKTKLKASYIENINQYSGIELSSKICKKNTKAAIILSEGLVGEDYEGFINGFKESNPDILVAGGLAGDNFKLQKTYVFLNDSIYDKGSVAVSFSSKSLYADNRYNLNWEPIGKEFTITKSDGNVVYEIDDENSVDLFKKYLGPQVFENNSKSLAGFQLLYKDGLTSVARTPMTRTDDALVFAAPLKEGQKVQFGFSNAASVISGSTHINNIIDKNPAEAIYVYSCIARKTLLGNSLEEEFANFQSIAPTAGFFTYGEYYSSSENNVLLNCSTTLLILSESNKVIQTRNTQKIEHTLDDITFNTLTHFIKQTSNELNSNVKLLNQYKNIVDASLLVSKTDTKGIITYVNDNFCKVSGYSKSELIGKNHNIVRNKDVSSFIFKKMWNYIKDGKVWHGQFPNTAKNGSIYYVDATVMPIFKDDKIDGYIAMRQDITKQVNAKNRIKENERFIKAIFDNQDSIVIVMSKQDGILSVNKAMFEYFDYVSVDEFKSRHKCIGELFKKEAGYIIPDKDSEWLDFIVDDPHVDHKAKIIAKNNKSYIFNVKVNKIDEQYIINLSDISNLEYTLQKAYSSEKAKSDFLANMSHEIRTPLNGILGFTDLLMKRELDRESSKYVDIVHKSGNSLLNIVNDILDFSKIESGEFILHKTESDLFFEMEAAASTFASTAKKKNIDYYVYIDTNIPKRVVCDVQRVKQVVTNLLSNAIKFTPQGGNVGVKIVLKEIKDNSALISFNVKDSGIGIQEDKIKTIFQAFSQADSSISRNFGGTGLGLSISKKFIDMMGDELKVKSKEGEGSEFYFELKLPVVNRSSSVEFLSSHKKANIVILQPAQEIMCEINKIVQNYLETWRYDFTIINSLAELDGNVDILIVCSKLFDIDGCKSALDNYEKLRIVYVEGGEDKFECTHNRYHLIQQPMTGSILFDTLAELTHTDYVTTVNRIKEVSQKFNGTILVAEDNATNQMLIDIMLKDRDLDYKIVQNGQEALDEALKNEYDIIFMDINMPVLDGVEATKQLRLKGYKKTIISLSANVIESDVQSYKEAGVDDSLAKPIVPDELDEILHKYLDKNLSVKADKKDFIVTKNVTDSLDFDTVDVSKIAKVLSIPNEAIIKKLLMSFSKSAKEILNDLKTEKLNKDNLHKIKGMAGNLRFNNLHDLCKKFEFELVSWSESENLKNREIVSYHINHIIDMIEELLEK